MEMRAVLEGAGVDILPPEKGGAILAHIRDIPVRLAVTGVGPLAAARMAGEFTGRGFLAPDTCRGVLNFGIAGTYSPDAAPLGSIVVADRETWPEYGIRTDGGVDAEALGFPLSGGKADPHAVWNAVPLDAKTAFAAMELFLPPDEFGESGEPGGSRVVFGGGITVAGVSGNAGIAGRLAEKYAALFENMEGFPLALAARETGVPFAEARAVSNIAGERSASAWDIPASLAALSRFAALVFTSFHP